MIPALVAQEIRETILDYLRTTWALSDRKLEQSLFQFLEGKAGDPATSIFRGPYLRLRLPFSPKPADAPVPLDIHPPYDPYLHQLQAWQRLSSRDGAEPQATLVTTGTGSGKTECFLYPLLDHCHRARERGEGGIKAIVLYPMNALAADQARRFAEVIHGDPRTSGKLRVGMYVGGNGRSREMTPDGVIDHKDILRKNPPDILLTNYRMLDLLLLRPNDQTLWQFNKPGTLRYLVLDELHTYDGAQGTDVACLIRRLTARLGGQDSLCPVGTSATVASDAGDAMQKLLEFASAVFDQPFADDAIIGESRRTPDEFFGLFQGPLAEGYPADPDVFEPEAGQEVEAHTRAVASVWFPQVEGLKTHDPEQFRLALGQAVVRHPLARALIQEASRKIVDEGELDEGLCRRLPELAKKAPEERHKYVVAMLTLLSWSQRKVGSRVMPLLQVQVQLWIREVRRLLRVVGDEHGFVWGDEHPENGERPALPMYYCRECGHSGWLTQWAKFGLSDELVVDYSKVAQASLSRSEDVLYLHQDQHAAGDDDSPLLQRFFDTKTRRLEAKSDGEAHLVPVHLWSKRSQGSPPRDQQTCPSCGTDGALSFLASRSASLASVSVGHLYTTPLNTDRKLLAFSDSVQDASHRAGFFSGRTYRFSIRSGMLAVVPDDGEMPLSAVAPAMFEYWRTRAGTTQDASPEAAMLAAFMPHDLEYLPDYQDYIERIADRARRQKEAEEGEVSFDEPVPEPSAKLLKDLRVRMRWEVTREFGVAARIGRTLERSGAASIAIAKEPFDEAVRLVVERVPERLGAARGAGEPALRQFVAGLLNRLRVRGGVHDELLQPFFESGGNSYQLSKNVQALLSPFGPRTTRPIFLGNSALGKFDNVAPRERTNWYSDWASRALGVPLSLSEARDLYAEVLPLLVKAQLLTHYDGGNKKYWGLRPEALVVSRRHAFRICDVCGYEQPTVSGSASDPLGGPCLRFRCAGSLQTRSDERESRAQGYYRRFYERKALGRVWASEHTGLLERSDREDLELAFKERPRPDAPNMLSCTPTLEMGIDIGDLSATMLCSVPPSTASYLQRVGRAGRSTGNALILTFAGSQQHDLHFYDDPMAVMDGAIRPPGCYLDAPVVLERQALAFCFDHFAQTGKKIPGRVRELLAETGPDAFPQSLFAFVAERREELISSFFDLFDRRVLRKESHDKLRAFLAGGGPGTSRMEQRLFSQIDAARHRRDSLKLLFKKSSERKKKLETDEALAKKLDDPEGELADLRSELGYLKAELTGLLDGDIWGFLCDASLLPNYAFPEAGVKLQAFVRSERSTPDAADEKSREFSWVRAPATAISELAPYNTFYGSGHKVQIDNVAVDTKDGQAAEWQFCAECHHSEPVAELDAEQQHCPACNAMGWQEKGRRRFLVKLNHVRAFTRQRDSVVSDESEDRDRAFYELHNFYDVTGAAAKNAWSNESAGFGFELLPVVKLRRINFGERDARVDNSLVGGRPVSDVSHVVCEECGQVRPPEARKLKSGKKVIAHRGSCAGRNKPEAKQRWRQVHLFRELSSEAIRLVLPVSQEAREERVANIRAALRLGLREFYGGDPEHLGVDTYDEPAGEEGRRNFLLIQDMVPGGTGLLAELTEDKGQKLRAVFQHAVEAMNSCPCRQRLPAVKGCYRCIYAYREQRVLHLLDRKVAIEQLEKMREACEQLKKVDTVGNLQIDSILESELEHRFRELVKSWGAQPGIDVEELDAEQLRLTVGARVWRYQPQVTLAEDQVLHKCRPDFMLYPEGQEDDVRPVAGFADGVAYHVQPKSPVGRIHDDFKKRAGIVGSGKFVAWSFGWDDLDAFSGSDQLGSWAEGNVLKSLERLINALGLKVGSVAMADPVRALLGYLTAPREWPALAGCMAAAALHAGGKQASEGAVEWELLQLLHAEEPLMKLTESVPGSDHLWARLSFGGEGEGALLLTSPRTEAGALHKNPGAVRGVLRLADSHAHRAKKNYTSSWRMFLRAYNLLQFLPNVQVVTEEQLTGVEAELVERPAPSVVVPLVRLEVPGELSSDAEALLSELHSTAPEWAVAVRQVMLAGHRRLVLPHEVRTNACSGDIELAWPARKVGAYLDDQRHVADHLLGQGWTLYQLESAPHVGDLLEALGAGDEA